MSPTKPTILRYDKAFSLHELGYTNASPDLVDYCKEEMYRVLSTSLGTVLSNGQPHIVQWLGWTESVYNSIIYLSGSYKITALESDTDANTG